MVDPQIVPILKKMIDAMKNLSPPQSRTPEEIRNGFEAAQRYWNQNAPEMFKVTETSLPSPFGPVAVRHYQPVPATQNRPVLVFFHGGGWVAGSLDTHDFLTRSLARRGGFDVISVDYGLAPERHFPETLDECTAVVLWLRENGSAWNLDSDRIAVGGDSAGGNISLALALKLRDRGENWLRFCMVFYAALDPKQESETHRLFGGIEFGNTPDRYRWFWDSYIPDKTLRDNPLPPLPCWPR